MAFIKIIDGKFIASESDLSPAKPNEIEQVRIENEALKARLAELEAKTEEKPKGESEVLKTEEKPKTK